MSRSRTIHPAAWWLWALLLAWATMRTSNPILLAVIAAVVGYVVVNRRSRAVWGSAFRIMLGLGVVTIAFTVLLQVVLGTRVPGHVLFRLPSWQLPSWTDGLSVGGPVTGEALLSAGTAGLRLAVLVLCFGAANSLAHPGRLLNLLPAALYELGVAAVVALTLVPQLAESIARVRRAQRLRGRSLTGIRSLRGLLVPVLEQSLERAITLAASMDSRGYGRSGAIDPRLRRLTRLVLLLGVCAALAGTFLVIDPARPHRLGVIALILGTALAVAASVWTGRQVHRTRYRRESWGRSDWLTVLPAVVTVCAYVIGHPHLGDNGAVAWQWPTLPLIPFLATLCAALPGAITPPTADPDDYESVPAMRSARVADDARPVMHT
ncbi:MAG: cobalt transporter permease [Frankiales bacterium]|nr:cobalt transporter permease [Frankiales bacterium]